MTKLAYDYDSPENNAKVRAARAKLPPTVGNHIQDKKERALFREGYAVAQVFEMEVDFRVEDGAPEIRHSATQQLSMMDKWTADPNSEMAPLIAGVVEGSKQILYDNYAAEAQDRLIYDYGSPDNCLAVYLDLVELAPEVGSHIVSEQGRAKYREGYVAAKALGIKAEFAVKENGDPTIFFHSPVQLPVLAQMMEYISNNLWQVDLDGKVEFFGRKFEHFGAGVCDAQEKSDVVGDLNEYQSRREDPTYDASKVAMSAKMAKYENARLVVPPQHYSDGKPKPKLIYDYDSEDNNETVALYLMHPDIATKGDHIPEADADGAVTLLYRNDQTKPTK